MTHMQACEDYLHARTGCYDYRRVRYAMVGQLMHDSLTSSDMVMDIGAGWTEFDYFLRTEMGWRGPYYPVDGLFDGTDLNTWVPSRTAAFVVGLEILEHLEDPVRMMIKMETHASKLVVATTPNPDTTDVLGMDPTHVTPVTKGDFQRRCWQVRERSLYGQERDSLLAWKFIG